jgi:hypothetical protein
MKNNDFDLFDLGAILAVIIILVGAILVSVAVVNAAGDLVGMVRYPIGRPVPPEIYTAVCDPCDPIYKFIPPADPSWTEMFGDNERTRLIHSISELRVVVVDQGIRLLGLEKALDPNDPNEVNE